ncbi:DUF4167 domain-containing protein [Sulfitobacter sp. SK012]|uniref:DUF4167 domain-containing protein n=1 Tax=Sulfitobacter sp. SK012 TaxID=1389005 RepID=UPI000E0A2073|nr:DUF4167 domain-containing protein [Sulfitobacter sp. SK012]AXI46245.1 DUF4167 domain-containing protein [Sulfitobacter sp. SK012]
MKSSRSRSRSKNNRNRGGGQQGGNVVNRVFDSSGPEGKVRGTPQQVIEKYNQLSRDAQLSNDRVAMENFQQHAEHYLRLLSEAQREMDSKREEQERFNRERQEEQDRQNRERQAERDRERAERQEREAANGGGDAPQGDQNSGHNTEQPSVQQPDVAPKEHTNRPKRERRPQTGHDTADLPDFLVQDTGAEESGLVETPESKPKPKRAPRRKPKPKEDAAPQGESDQPDAAE